MRTPKVAYRYGVVTDRDRLSQRCSTITQSESIRQHRGVKIYYDYDVTCASIDLRMNPLIANELRASSAISAEWTTAER